MSDNIKNGLLVIIAIATIANTVILLGDDGVSYNKTATKNASSVSNAAANKSANPAIQNDLNQNENKGADVVETNTGPKTDIKFGEMEHDFGTIEQNTTNPKTFTFTNTGENPLIISDAKGSCGCTVPQYPKAPIQPGETGEIQVVYKPGKQKNQQTKTVTITANTEPATTVLRIKANVNPGEDAVEGEAAETQSIQIGS
jgi:hypothetical protein